MMQFSYYFISLDPNILKAFSICDLMPQGDKFHSCTKQGKIIVLFILIVACLCRRQEDRYRNPDLLHQLCSAASWCVHIKPEDRRMHPKHVVR
jgi:hypothetical protein